MVSTSDSSWHMRLWWPVKYNWAINQNTRLFSPLFFVRHSFLFSFFWMWSKKVHMKFMKQNRICCNFSHTKWEICSTFVLNIEWLNERHKRGDNIKPNKSNNYMELSSFFLPTGGMVTIRFWKYIHILSVLNEKENAFILYILFHSLL